MLSILTLNVQATSRARAQRILDWATTVDWHVLVLTETSHGPGTVLMRERFRRAGLTVVHTPPADGDRGCMIVSRLPAIGRTDLVAGVGLPGRAVALTLHNPAVTVLGLYVPSSDRSPDKIARKQAFLGDVLQLLRVMPQQERARLVMAGDLNVISRRHQPAHPGFLAFEYGFLDTLPGFGLTDAHQVVHPGDQPHSWVGRVGNRYRFDYVYAGSALVPALTASEYLQVTREQRLSDHAAVLVSLGVPVPQVEVAVLPPAEALF